MKICMLKIFASLTMVTLLIVAGCNPEDQDHLKIPALVSGGTVRAVLPPENSFLDFTDITKAKLIMDLTAYDFEGGKLVQSYDIYVSYTDLSAGETYDEKLYTKVTTFPSRLEITSQNLADFFELPNGIDDLDGGDTFAFTMEVHMKDGRIFTAENTSDDIVLENNSRGTFFLNTFVGCPSALAGNYKLEIVSSNIGLGNFAQSLDATITQVSPAVYELSDGTMDFFGPDFPIGMKFLEICGSIFIQAPSVDFPTLVIFNQGAGTSYDQETGVITFDVTYNDASCCGLPGIQYTFTATPE